MCNFNVETSGSTPEIVNEFRYPKMLVFRVQCHLVPLSTSLQMSITTYIIYLRIEIQILAFTG